MADFGTTTVHCRRVVETTFIIVHWYEVWFTAILEPDTLAIHVRAIEIAIIIIIIIRHFVL